jgi:hypothetical protein
MVPSGSFLRNSIKYSLVDWPSRVNFEETVGSKERSVEEYRSATPS